MSNRRGSVILSAIFVAIVASAAANAASPAQAGSRSNDRNVVTVVGCVRNADESVVGTGGGADAAVAGTAGTSSPRPNDSSIKFMLVNVTSGSSNDVVGTSGTKSGSAPLGYRLDGDAQTLNPHVGHKVEIAATIANPGSTASPENSSILITAPRLKVISVRTLAPTCQ
jgi:hypothetical protein